MESDQAARMAASFEGRPGVTRGRAFATDSLMVNGKIFALFRPEGVVFKLPKDRVDSLIATGPSVPFTNGNRTMKEWVVVPKSQQHVWMELAEEAFEFVTSLVQGPGSSVQCPVKGDP